MKNQASTACSRRRFLAATTTSAAMVSVVPGRVLGADGAVAPSGKINVAFIGVGSQGLRVMLNFLRQTDVQIVSVCDVNKGSSDFPEWGRFEFRDGVKSLLGDTSAAWDWLSTENQVELTRTQKVTAGTAGREPCQKIVNACYALPQRSGSYRGCSAYNDFRELLEKEKDLDGVVVCTTDHWHALASIAAMRKGKHVWCQKPMTRTVHEARRMREVAREAKVATQVAVGPAASESTRVLCEWVSAGVIGPVRQVHNWSNRPVWRQGLERPAESQPVPAWLDWDLWLGPAPERPFHSIYQPFHWRGWYDFGAGALGDMGCYSFDVIFRALKLTAPTTIEASSSELFPETFPKASTIHFEFPARGNFPPVKITWHDGGLKPVRPPVLEDTGKLPAEGLLFVGDRGALLCDFTGENPRLLPVSRQKDFQPPQKTLPRSIGHDREWIEACKGAKEKPGANFEFSADVTETILLGNVALRTGEKLVWDRANLRASNSQSATQFIQPEYRAGWKL